MMKKSGILALVAVLLVAVLVFAACSPATPAAESSAPADDASPASSGEASASAADSGKKLKFGEIAHDRALEWVNYGVQNFE